MAAPKINSFQLSDICSLGIMTAHSTVCPIMCCLNLTFSLLGLFYLSLSFPRLHSFIQLLKGRGNISDLSFLIVIIVSGNNKN